MFLLPFKQSKATSSNRIERYSERCSDFEESVPRPDVESAPRPKRQKKRSSNDEDAILRMPRQRQEEKSLMTSVDKFTESQIDFIRSLRARTESQVSTCTSMPQRDGEERRYEQQQRYEQQRFEEEYRYAGTSSLFEL